MNLMPWKKTIPATTTMLSTPVSTLQYEMNRIFDQFLGSPFGTSFEALGVFPPVSVCETDKDLVVSAEIPGIRPHDVDISVEGTMLTLRGEKKLDKMEKLEDVAWYQAERNFGSFLRRIELPAPVDANHVDASAENGVLTIKLPKLAASKTKTIKVQAK